MINFRQVTIRSLRRRFGSAVDGWSNDALYEAWQAFSTTREYAVNSDEFLPYLRKLVT